jgi:molecular chaperone GrpE
MQPPRSRRQVRRWKLGRSGDLGNGLGAEAKAAEHLDGWQSALADFQNYRKRVERDRDAERVAMKGDLIRSVLPVLDDLERALQNRPEDDAWSNGIELIQRKLLGLLEAEGVKRIEAEGAVFDPNFHEAIAQETAADVESGRVIAVMQQGYTLVSKGTGYEIYDLEQPLQ